MKKVDVWANFVRQKNKGITLIALVITIIIMLILVAVTVSYSIKSGLITKAQDAKVGAEEETEKQIIGNLYQEYLVARETGEIKETDFVNYICSKQKETSEESTENKYTITDKNAEEGIVEIEFSNTRYTLSNKGEIKVKGDLDSNKSYIGYYADVDGNGTVDGVIFVDLMKGANNNQSTVSGIWNNDSDSKYNYATITESKEYKIIGEYTDSHFGTHKVISTFEGTKGNDRFYVMALNDMDSTAYKWDEDYSLVGYKVNNTETLTTNNIANGRTNTETLISKLSNKTLWKKIKENYQDESGNLTWFVPSKAEWSAFGDFMYSKIEGTKCNTSNWKNTFGFEYCYWSSSQRGTDRAYRASFEKGWIGYHYINGTSLVRLATTF